MSESGARQQQGSAVLSTVSGVADPAAGADWVSVQTTTQELIAIHARLVTSATVANRVPTLQISNGAGQIVWRAAPLAAQAAGATVDYVWGVDVAAATGQGVAYMSLPAGMVMGNNWVMQTVTAAIQAGDQWSQVAWIRAG